MKKTDLEGIAAAIVTGIKAATKPLEQRIAALERKPHVKFCGVYERGKAYQPGDACTHDGGLWICKSETTGQPKQDFYGWQLAVKSRSL